MQDHLIVGPVTQLRQGSSPASGASWQQKCCGGSYLATISRGRRLVYFTRQTIWEPSAALMGKLGKLKGSIWNVKSPKSPPISIYLLSCSLISAICSFSFRILDCVSCVLVDVLLSAMVTATAVSLSFSLALCQSGCSCVRDCVRAFAGICIFVHLFRGAE